MKKSLILFIILLVTNLSWGQEDVDFKYEFKRDKSDSTLVNVNAKIINKTDKNVYFLSQTCNGLDYFLSTSSSDAEVYIILHCFATYPRKIEIKTNSEYTFKTTIKLNREIDQIGLNLEFVQLTQTALVDKKWIRALKKENIKSTSNIKGQVIKID